MQGNSINETKNVSGYIIFIVKVKLDENDQIR